MTRSRTAPFRTARTVNILVAMVVGAYPSASIEAIQDSMWEARRFAIWTPPNVTFRRTRSFWTCVMGAQTCRSAHRRKKASNVILPALGSTY